MAFSDRRGGYEDSKRYSSNNSSNADKFAARLYVGRLSRSISERDIDEAFGKYGRIREVDMKIGFCFVQFDDPRDADDAMRALDGVRIQGNDERVLVEFARGSTWRGARDSRHGSGSRGFDGRPPERCFNCGQVGHWARDCPQPPGSGERSRRYEENRCFTCGQPGHRARDCTKYGYSSRGRSRSPYRSSRDRSPRRYSRSPYRRESDRDRDRDKDRERDKDKDRDRDHDKEREKGDKDHDPIPKKRSASPIKNSRKSLTPQ